VENMQLPIKRIMAPIDGSKNALAALQVAVSLAKDYHAELIIVRVLPVHSTLISVAAVANAPPSAVQQSYEDEEKNAKRMLDDRVQFAKKHGVKASGLILSKQTSVVQAIIISAVDQKVDLIVIGTRGLGGFKRLLMGSVSTGVVTHAHCPVLVVR
jgi:nucleotide-binding universal stress UspA family protein